MTIDDKIIDEKQQYDINREAAKASPLSSRNSIEDEDKKQIKAIEDHGRQLVESNELIKKTFNTDSNNLPLEEQKNI